MLVFLLRLLLSILADFLVVGTADDDDTDELDAVLVGIRELVVAVAVATCRLFVFFDVLCSLSNFRLAGMGDDRSETLRLFGRGVTFGDNVALLFGDFVTVVVNFFKCSTR